MGSHRLRPLLGHLLMTSFKVIQIHSAKSVLGLLLEILRQGLALASGIAELTERNLQVPQTSARTEKLYRNQGNTEGGRAE